jgi:hypothetical protein
VDEVAPIRDTISHYAPVLIAQKSVRGGPEFFLEAPVGSAARQVREPVPS